jgi:hypothetical protein
MDELGRNMWKPATKELKIKVHLRLTNQERLTMKSLVLVIGLLVCSASYAAELWREPEDFRGLKWGDSESHAFKLYPSLRPIPMPSAPAGSTYYSLLNAKVGDVSVIIGLTFWRGGFAQAYLGFSSKDYATIEAAFLERYGAPTKTTEEMIQNRMGAQFTNRKHQWVGQNVSIYLTKFSGTVTNGSAILATKEYLSAFGNRTQERGKDAAKDL